MESITYSYARQNLADAISKVCEDHDPLIITNKRNKSVVMLSLEDYEALQETAYLIRGPKNAKRLFESIKQLESGKGKKKELLN
jgi:antitoxin YefM